MALVKFSKVDNELAAFPICSQRSNSLLVHRLRGNRGKGCAIITYCPQYLVRRVKTRAGAIPLKGIGQTTQTLAALPCELCGDDPAWLCNPASLFDSMAVSKTTKGLFGKYPVTFPLFDHQLSNALPLHLQCRFETFAGDVGVRGNQYPICTD